MWIKDGAVFTSHSDIRKTLKQVSLPASLTDEVLAAFGFEAVEVTSTPPVDHTQNVVEDPPEKVNGKWRRVFRVVAASPEETDARTKAKTAEVMAVRDGLIQAFFWAELLTPTVNAGQYRKHLDDLRDVTKQPGFPWTVTWPAKP